MHPAVMQYLAEAHIAELHRSATPRAGRIHRPRFAAARARVSRLRPRPRLDFAAGCTDPSGC